MDCNKLKEKLERIACHIHGDAAHVTLCGNDAIEIETCCLLFREQLLLMAGEDEKLVRAIKV